MASQIENKLNELYSSRKWSELWGMMNDLAKAESFRDNGEDIMIFPCGFASVKIFDYDKVPDDFIKWLQENDFFRLEKRRWGKKPWIWRMSVSGFNQSMSHKETFAMEMAKYFKAIEIDSSWSSRMD